MNGLSWDTELEFIIVTLCFMLVLSAVWFLSKKVLPWGTFFVTEQASGLWLTWSQSMTTFWTKCWELQDFASNTWWLNMLDIETCRGACFNDSTIVPGILHRDIIWLLCHGKAEVTSEQGAVDPVHWRETERTTVVSSHPTWKIPVQLLDDWKMKMDENGNQKSIVPKWRPEFQL